MTQKTCTLFMDQIINQITGTTWITLDLVKLDFELLGSNFWQDVMGTCSFGRRMSFILLLSDMNVTAQIMPNNSNMTFCI